jgi:hypothetical protein
MRKLRNAILCLVLLVLNGCTFSEETHDIDPIQATEQAYTATLLSYQTLSPKKISSYTPTPFPTATITPTKLTPVVGTVIFPTPTPILEPPVWITEYRLVSWDEGRAVDLIERLYEYPEYLSVLDRGYHDSIYYFSHRSALVAIEEAMLRFPNSHYMSTWRWQHAYLSAVLGENSVNQEYSSLIETALNNGESNLDSLRDWFESLEPDLQLKTQRLKVPDIDSYLLTISRGWYTGVFIHALYSGPSWELTPLSSRTDFGFTSAAGIYEYFIDVTGDGIAEIVTEHSHQHGGPGWVSSNVDIFDVSSGFPRKIYFLPREPGRFMELGYGNWSEAESSQSGGIILEAPIRTIVCDTFTREEYHWNGWELVLQEIEIFDNPDADFPLSCLDRLFNDLMNRSMEGDQVAWEFAGKLIDQFPSRIINTESDYGVRSLEEAKFLFGLYGVFLRRYSEAESSFHFVAQKFPLGKFGQIAKDLTDNAQAMSDLGSLCRSTPTCRGRIELDDLFQNESPTSIYQIPQLLESFSYETIDELIIDANRDELMDYLFIIPDERFEDNVEAWFVSSTTNGLQFIKKDLWSIPTSLEYLAYSSPLKATILRAIYEDEPSDILVVSNIFENVTFEGLDTFYLHALDLIKRSLMEGGDLALLEEQLNSLGHLIEKYLLCSSVFRRCSEYEYLHGLVHELLGDEAIAANHYKELWTRDQNTGYAMMARYKLVP